MSRLIDADKLIKYIEKSRKENPHNDIKIASNHNFEHFHFIKLVNEQPTGFDIDDILRQCKDKAIQLMNKQYNEDEYHMFSKGVQAMYLGLEKIIKENKIYSEIDVDMCLNCTKSKYTNQSRR